MKILKWRCILSFEEMTKYLSDWYRFYYNKKSKMSEITIDQISEKKLRRLSNRNIFYEAKIFNLF